MNGFPGAQAVPRAFFERYSKSNSSYLISNSVNFLRIPTTSHNISISTIAQSEHLVSSHTSTTRHIFVSLVQIQETFMRRHVKEGRNVL